MININEGLNLLRRIKNHLTETETYEEATTDRDLAEEINKFFLESQLQFKTGSDVNFGDKIFVDEQLTNYNEAMILPLNKIYAVI